MEPTPELIKELQEQKLLLISKMETLRKYREDNRIEYFNTEGFMPNPRQAELLDAWNDRFFRVYTYTGGNRSGKTFLGVYTALCVMFGKWMYPGGRRLNFPHRFPRRVRVVGQGWQDHIKTVIIPQLEYWWPKNRPVKVKKNQVGIEAMWTDEITGSTLEVMSSNQEVKVFEGWNGDMVYYDEPSPREIRIANARGLVDRLGRELFCMTLLSEAWVSREIINKKLDNGKPDPSVFNTHAEIYDNIGYGITKEGIDTFAGMLTDDEKDARLRGIPSYMSGLVYPQFKAKYRPNGHLMERFTVPLDWVVDIAIDIHPRENQAVLFCATDPKQERYLCDEIWGHGDGTWVGEEIIRYIMRNSYRVANIIIDPLSKADSNQEDTTFRKIAMVLMRYGYILQTASKDKTSGILNVKTHLEGPNKQPSLFIFDDMVRTVMEMEGYMYVDKGENKGKIQDKDDHMMENLYRILLLDTQYVTPYDEDDDEDDYEDSGGDGKYTSY